MITVIATKNSEKVANQFRGIQFSSERKFGRRVTAVRNVVIIYELTSISSDHAISCEPMIYFRYKLKYEHAISFQTSGLSTGFLSSARCVPNLNIEGQS